MHSDNEDQTYCPICRKPVDKTAVTCPHCKAFLSFNRKLEHHEGEETVPVTPEEMEMKTESVTEGLFKDPEEKTIKSVSTDEREDLDELDDVPGYASRVRDGHPKKNLLIYGALFLLAGFVAVALILTGADKKITDVLFGDTPEKEVVVERDTLPEDPFKEIPEEEVPFPEETGTGEFPPDEVETTQGSPVEDADSAREETGPAPDRDTAAADVKKPQVIAPKSVSQGKSVYSVQVGAFAVEKNADAFSNTLIQKGYDAFIKTDTRADGTRLHRVLVGRFDIKKKAFGQSKELLQKENIKSYVYRH